MTTPTIYSPTEPSPIQGWRLLLEGPFGCGKTTALRHVLDLHKDLGIPEPMKLRVLSLDPNTWSVLGNTEAKLSMIRTVGTWDMLKNVFKHAQEMDNTQIQGKDFRASREEILVNLVTRMMHFVAVDKVDYGCVGDWGTDTVLAIDGLTGLTEIIATGNLGPKPAWTQPDYQRVMNCIKQFLEYTLQNCYCHVVLIAHVEMEADDLGKQYIMPSTAGKKLAPKIGRGFSDIVYAEKEENKFTWSTTKRGAELRSAHLPFQAGLAADLRLLFTSDAAKDPLGPAGWLKRGGIISPVVPKQWTEPEYYKV